MSIKCIRWNLASAGRRLARSLRTAVTGTALVILAGSQPVMAADALEKEDLKFGFIKLTDMAPLAIAYEKGYFEDEGLYVTLEPQANWKVLLDRVIDGELDGAHMLAGQPLGATIGFGTKAHVITALSMDLNGNGITVSKKIWEQMKKHVPHKDGKPVRFSAVVLKSGDLVEPPEDERLDVLTELLEALFGGGQGDEAVHVLAPADEAAIGIINGVVISTLSGLGGGLLTGDATLGFVITIAIAVNFIVAGIAGAGIPVALRWVGQDPALASNIFLTMITDIVGFGGFLLTATLLL